jgi:hypothetical protein
MDSALTCTLHVRQVQRDARIGERRQIALSAPATTPDPSRARAGAAGRNHSGRAEAMRSVPRGASRYPSLLGSPRLLC